MEDLVEKSIAFIPLLIAVAIVIGILLGMNWLLLVRHPDLGNERKLPRQLIMLGLTVAGAVAIALSLPVSESTRNQVLTLIGVLLSAMIAFSSTTIVANLMGGIMLRMTKSFRTGDFLTVGEHFGRVAERGLLDTEVQSVHRELISLPNTYLINNPVIVLRSTGTMIHSTLSLGYDVHHSKVEKFLIDAATNVGLEEPFVEILELGNFAVTYRVNGLLKEVKALITTRSNLQRMILDTLHANGIEIVSPTVMDQRRIPTEAKLVPEVAVEGTSMDNSKPEDIVFDKAERSANLEEEKLRIVQEIKELEERIKHSTGREKEQLHERLKTRKLRLEVLNDRKVE